MSSSIAKEEAACGPPLSHPEGKVRHAAFGGCPPFTTTASICALAPLNAKANALLQGTGLDVSGI